MTPDFKVIAAGGNITPRIKDRLLRLTVTDQAGTRADTVEIELDDQGGLIDQPMSGASMLVFLGYRETGLIPMGLFASDEVTVSARPAPLIIRARAAASAKLAEVERGADTFDATMPGDPCQSRRHRKAGRACPGQ